MVVLLDKAVRTRRAQLLKKSKVDALEEIIRIQDILLVLCQKARDWKTKPTTDRPITRPTILIQRPLKALRKRFGTTLADRKRRLQRKIADAKARQLEEESAQEAWEEAQRKVKAHQARNRLIHEALARKEAELRPAPLLSQLQPKGQVSEGRTEKKNHWSCEQDKVLLKEIFAEEHGDIPAEERFLRVLNVPLLKNKLPGHIRERMLCFKEAIEVTRSKQGRPVEEWLLAME
ncbi:MAG: hypothetical protein Q9184_007776 [Pyrenodesmia sp. 2 TL-2023]